MTQTPLSASAIRFDEVNPDLSRELMGTRPVVIFAEQGALGVGQKAQGDSRELSHGDNLVAPSKMSRLGRVIIIFDRSGSMATYVSESSNTKKLTYVQDKVNSWSPEQFPCGTALSLISFNEQASLDFDGTGTRDLKAFQEATNQIRPGGLTDFENPLTIAKRLIEEDVQKTGSPERNLVMFITDGKDNIRGLNRRDGARSLASELRDLNCGTYILGVGTDYSMKRVMELASAFGFCGWAHAPQPNSSEDYFQSLIPNFVQEMLSAEQYLKINAAGAYRDFYSATHSFKRAVTGRTPREVAGRMNQGSVYAGYAIESYGILFEKNENLKLELQAGRFATDRDGFAQQIDIGDSDDLRGSQFEKVRFGEDLIRQYLALQALRQDDVRALEALNEQYGDGRFERRIEEIRRGLGPQSADSYNGGTQALFETMVNEGTVRNTAHEEQVNQWSAVPAKGTAKEIADKPDVPDQAKLRDGSVERTRPKHFEATLDLLLGEIVVPHFLLGKPGQVWNIGRSQQNDIRLNPASLGLEIDLSLGDISRFHAQLHVDVLGNYFLSDVGSRHGTFVNEKRIEEETLLKQGDIVRLGEARFRFSLEGR